LLGEIAPDIRSTPRDNLPTLLDGAAAATEAAMTEPGAVLGVTGLELPGEVLSEEPGRPGREALLVLGAMETLLVLAAIAAACSGNGSRRIVGIPAGSPPVVDRRGIMGEEVRC
jgi:hypothetical protein